MQVWTLHAARAATVLLTALLSGAPAANAQTAPALKVLDWNTHHGVGTDGVYDPQRFIPVIANSGANVVSLNEVEKFTSWGNEDQPARYAALLEAATGKRWYHAFATRDGAANGQGNLILSTFPIEAANATTLSYTRAVTRAQIVVNGVRVHVFSTHLDADSGARRAQQMGELKAWASNFSQPQVIAGDFNAWPGAPEIANMTAFAYDGWATAKSNGTALAYAGNEAGNTRTSRIDYVWFPKAAGQLVLKAAQVFDTQNAAGTMPSDHRPVMATFQVGSAAIVGDSAAPVKANADFDGDRKADLSLYRPSTGLWIASRSGGAGVLQVAWGAQILGDIPVPGDYDGDGRADAAVFRPVDGTWYIRYSSTGGGAAIQWASSTDVPVPADYDGDGRTDLAVFRPSNHTWYVRYSGSGSTMAVSWGGATDRLVPGDYDGDRKADVAVFRPSTGTWFVRFSSTGQMMSLAWGGGVDVAVPGDYDGDGRTDLAVFRPSNGTWYVRASNGAVLSWVFGAAGDLTVAGDYDGDGKTDLAVYRPWTGTWYVRHSSTGAVVVRLWGTPTDLPILVR